VTHSERETSSCKDLNLSYKPRRFNHGQVDSGLFWTAVSSVSFVDGDQHCRVVAFRVQKIVLDEVMTQETIALESTYLEDTPAGRRILEALAAGTISPSALEAANIERFVTNDHTE
jgi:hypothetical protein